VVSGASTATTTISAASGNDATLNLQQGTNAFKMVNKAYQSKLFFTDGTNDLMSLSRTDGAVVTRGDVTVGGTTSTGAKTLTVASSDSTASVAIQSAGANAASLSVTAPLGQDASLTLEEVSGRAWKLTSDASSNAFTIGEGANDGNQAWLTIEQTTGAALFRGDLSTSANLAVGTSSSSGAKSVTVQSPDDVASLVVTGAGAKLDVTSATDALVSVKAQQNRQAGVTLTEDGGGSVFHLINDGVTDMFKIKDGTSDLLTMATSSGDTTIKGGMNVKSGKFVVDSTTGYVGVWASNPSVQLHVNGSMKVDNGDFTVGSGKLFVSHTTGYIGVNNYAPSEAIHVKGNVKIEPDASGNGGHLFATKGAVHFKYSNAATGSVDREYYMATRTGVSLPANQAATCTASCVPTSNRIYMIRNKRNDNAVIIGIEGADDGTTTVRIRKNGGNDETDMVLNANGMALCGFDTVNQRYDCWTWNE